MSAVKGSRVAYQVFGSGSLDMLCIPGWVSNVEAQWQFPPTANFYSRLGEFARVIQVDRRGTGLSDRLSPKDLPPCHLTRRCPSESSSHTWLSSSN